MYLKTEDKETGKQNFELAISAEIAKDEDGKEIKDAKGNYQFNRREFLAGTVGAGVVSGGGLGAMYFGYGKTVPNPLRVGFIGTGDEGCVLLGAHNPEYMNVVAIADIRPYNVHRAFHGDWSSPNAIAARPGLLKKYGWKSEDEARKQVKVYGAYEALLDDPNVEAVVIALPLHLHAEATIKALRKGKHVLTEKLMGQTVAQCKEMGRVSAETNLMLATGHQRHYSILYDNAKHTIRNGFIGDIHHIRAQWHRNNLPGKDSWQPEIPSSDRDLAKLKKDLDNLEKKLKALDSSATGLERDRLVAQVAQKAAQLKDEAVKAQEYGYMEKVIKDPVSGQEYKRSALEELIRWRLWERTGGGLMAELGSHQLDASTIFCTEAAKKNDPKFKAHPLTVTAIGGRHIFPFDREAEDHVYCMFEFPGAKYDTDKNNKIVVTYSSINGNGFGDYGEVVMGTKGTMILLREQEAMLFDNAGPSTKVNVAAAGGVDTTASGGAAAPSAAGPISRGYTEELEHWAWCIRNQGNDKVTDLVENEPVRVPRCHPKVAMADAIIALATNMCMRNPSKPQITFDEAWFDINNDATPEGDKPDVNKSQYSPSSTSKATV
jgi:predicted dehydrogenase